MSRAREFADLAGSADAGGLTGRNLIINGAMQVAQRSTSVTGIGGANGFFTVDRWQIFQGGSTSGRLTQSQASVTDLAGFPNSLKHEVTTADTSIAAGELLQISQTFEGQNLQALKKGYSDASSFTVSFYVKGTAKTYVVEMYDGDNNRHVAQTFSVTSSWSRVELTFPADTTGKFDDDNGLSLYLIIWLHAGSTYTSGTLPSTWASATNANRAVGAGSLFSATSNTFEITGAQLEVGEKATPFEHRSFGDELARCQRYYEKSYAYSVAPGTAASYPGNIGLTVRGQDEETSGQRYFTQTIRVEKRGSPTNTFYDDAGNSGKVTTFDSGGTPTNNVSIGLVVAQNSMIGCGPGNSAIWGYSFFYESDAEL
tara:strand:+ start:209 stop:1318 length:1110 start_codon:yes stop_codon:yes gene_type:complete